MSNCVESTDVTGVIAFKGRLIGDIMPATTQPVPVARHNTQPDEKPIAPSSKTPECEWGSVKSASATLAKVSINNTPYKVRGRQARSSFYQRLYVCDPAAANAFKVWRQHRRTTNVLAFGIFIPFVIMIAPVFGVEAHKAKTKMLNHIKTIGE